MRNILPLGELAADEALADYATKNWTWYLFVAIASVLFGFVVMSFNFATLFGLAVSSLLASSSAWAWWRSPGLFRPDPYVGWHIVSGILSIVAGVLICDRPGISVFLMAIFTGWTLLFWGIADIVGSLMIRHASYWWLELIRGIVSVLLGIWALRHPGQALLAFVDVIGIWAVVRGTSEVIESFEMKNARRHWDRVKAEAVP